MTPQQFAQIVQLMDQIFKSSERARKSDALVVYVRSNFPAWQEIDQGEAVVALMAMKMRGQVWEPSAGEVAKEIARAKGDTYARSPEQMWDHLVAAIRAHGEARRNGASLRTEFVEREDGRVEIRREQGTARWRVEAGEHVEEFVESRGGIEAVSQRYDDPTLYAQFRDWWRSRAGEAMAKQSIAAGSRAAMQLVHQLAALPPELREALPSLDADRLAEIGMGSGRAELNAGPDDA